MLDLGILMRQSYAQSPHPYTQSRHSYAQPRHCYALVALNF